MLASTAWYSSTVVSKHLSRVARGNCADGVSDGMLEGCDVGVEDGTAEERTGRGELLTSKRDGMGVLPTGNWDGFTVGETTGPEVGASLVARDEQPFHFLANLVPLHFFLWPIDQDPSDLDCFALPFPKRPFEFDDFVFVGAAFFCQTRHAFDLAGEV